MSNPTTVQLKGNVVFASDPGTTTTIGNSTGAITTNANQIVQNISGIGGDVQYVVGNANNATSMSTTFCRKNTSTMTALDCFTITKPVNYSSQAFDIIVSGANQSYGGYSYKGSFYVSSTDTTVTVSSLFTYLTNGLIGVTFNVVGNVVTVKVNGSSGTNQCFVATLIAYPSVDITNQGFDYSVSAV